MTTEDDVKQEMQEAASNVIPFRGNKYITLVEASSYIKSFVRADVLKLLQSLKNDSNGKDIPIEKIDRLIELYITH